MIAEEEETFIKTVLSGIVNHVIRGDVMRDWPNSMGFFSDDGFQEIMCFQMPFETETFTMMVKATWLTARDAPSELGDPMGLYWTWRSEGPRYDDAGVEIFDEMGAISGLLCLADGRLACMVYPISPEYRHWVDIDPEKTPGNEDSPVLASVRTGMGL